MKYMVSKAVVNKAVVWFLNGGVPGRSSLLLCARRRAIAAAILFLAANAHLERNGQSASLPNESFIGRGRKAQYNTHG